VVGYGASPNECCAVVRELAAVTLLGNHDAAVAGRMDYASYYEGARHALDWTVSRLAPEHLAWLAGLPHVHRDGDAFGLSHGSPLVPEDYEYLYELDHARELLPLAAALPEVTFFGHSHLPRAFALAGGQVHDVLAPRIPVKRGVRYLVSVGSVGQPRDLDPRACFAVYDTEAREIAFHRVGYDVEAAAQKIFDADLFLDFGRRLFQGR
jgi:diadenosine tetraphosphatase ApaH/serine/threonine PP2A family protein phosphatase